MSVIIDGEEYLNAGDAARYLKVSAASFTKYAKQYKLPYMTRIGGGRSKLFKKKDLDEKLLKYQLNTPE